MPAKNNHALRLVFQNHTYNSSIHSPSSTALKFSVVTTWTSLAAKPSSKDNNKMIFRQIAPSVNTAILAYNFDDHFPFIQANKLTKDPRRPSVCVCVSELQKNYVDVYSITGTMTTRCRRMNRLPYLLSASLFLLVLHVLIVGVWRQFFPIEQKSLCQ